VGREIVRRVARVFDLWRGADALGSWFLVVEMEPPCLGTTMMFSSGCCLTITDVGLRRWERVDRRSCEMDSRGYDACSQKSGGNAFIDVSNLD